MPPRPSSRNRRKSPSVPGSASAGGGSSCTSSSSGSSRWRRSGWAARNPASPQVGCWRCRRSSSMARASCCRPRSRASTWQATVSHRAGAGAVSRRPATRWRREVLFAWRAGAGPRSPTHRSGSAPTPLESAPMMVATQELQLVANTIRALAMDAVQKADSGHPGTPMALADVAFGAVDGFLRYDPTDPKLARPRPLRALGGHASMLLYSLLHLARLRALARGARSSSASGAARPAGPPGDWHTAGRRDHHRPARPGLRQRGRHGARRSSCWPRASADELDQSPHLRARLSDGDLMEGVASEAASLAGHSSSAS